MPKFHVSITRSASQTITLEVEAKDADTAEAMVEDKLGQSHRVTYEELEKAGFEIYENDYNPDEESHWEIEDCCEAAPDPDRDYDDQGNLKPGVDH
jgi:hypothetical protein